MNSPTSRGGLVVFSGGSAANNLVDVFNDVVAARKCDLNYVIPISDNGGSTSELIRVFGGPGIGDLRSRLVRLITDNDGQDTERHALKTIFNHRLSSDPQEARLEWLDFVEASHVLWKDIKPPKQELIRSFLNVLNLEIVKRMRPSSVFNFANASVGNLFITAARLFTGSLESAIYLLSSICNVPSHVAVLPAINTNFTHHICAGLANGDRIVGQNSISHPSEPTALPSSPVARRVSLNVNSDAEYADAGELVPSLTPSETEQADDIEDANLPGSLPTLRKQYIAFSKDQHEDGSDDLAARIERIWYINPYGQEIRPPPNPRIIDVTRSADTIIYSIGSLYTSLLPCLILRGVGDAIAMSSAQQKILILNGSIDRETGPLSQPYDALDFVKAVVKASRESRGLLTRQPKLLDLAQYVTHVIYLGGEGTPVVDRTALAEAGIEAIRVYGRRMDDGKGYVYDAKALSQALEAIVGRKHVRLDRSRRNTLEA